MYMEKLKNLLLIILLIGIPFATVVASEHYKLKVNVVKDTGVCAAYHESKDNYKPHRAPQSGSDKLNSDSNILYLTFFSDCGTVITDVEKEGQGIVSEQLIQTSVNTSVPIGIVEFGIGSYNVVVKSEFGEVLFECVVTLE